MSGILRNPRWQITCAGNDFAYSEAKVTQTKAKNGDTFSAKGALSLVDLGWWLSVAPPVAVTITCNGTQLFAGNVDLAEPCFDENTFSISGRDAAAALTESQTSEKFLNQKPEQIVQTLAQRHGITAVMDSTDSTDSGKQFTTDFDAISHRGSEWSLINRLADHYGMVAYMTGGKLYFKKYNEQLPLYQIHYSPPTPAMYATGNFIRFSAARNFILGKPIKHNVHSHNHHKKEVIMASATSQGGSGEPLIYNHTISGINQDQAQTIATAKLAETSAHEITIKEFNIPGDETITARMQFQLTGTNSQLDGTYDTTDISHAISLKEGFRTGLNIKNKKSGGSGGGSNGSGKGSGKYST